MHILEQKFPAAYALEWDNVGLLVGDGEQEVQTVFVALDATSEVIQRAIEAKADLLITHHPMIFSAVRQVNTGDFLGSKIIELIKHDIACYALHTNFDVCGMADLSANLIHLQDTQVLEVTYENEQTTEGIGRIGRFSEQMTLKEVAQRVKSQLHLPHVAVYGNQSQKVTFAAISTGSGKGMIDIAKAKGADVLITGDIDHHAGLDALDKGISIIDAGHYGTEYIFMEHIKQMLEQEKLPLHIICMVMALPYEMV